MRSSAPRPRRVLGLLVAAACSLHALPIQAAAPAPLPEWDVKKKPAPLPDWDTATRKPAPDKAKKPRTKKPRPDPDTPAETVATPEPITPGPAPEPTPEPVAAPEPAPEPVATPEPTPTVPPPVVTTRPDLDPSTDSLASRERDARQARGEVIAGGVLVGLGVAGLGIMTAGLLRQRAVDDPGEARISTDTTLIAAGAVLGISAALLGTALLVDGIRDRNAVRARTPVREVRKTGRARVHTVLGNLVLGRF